MLNRDEIKTALWDLRNISISCNGLYIEAIESLEETLDENKYKVAVIGEFSSGKSTFLNALVGKKILYASNDEATGVITYLEKGNEKRASIFMENNIEKEIVKEIELNSIENYKKLSNYCDINNQKDKVTSIAISYPLKGIDKNISFIDTPGLQGINKKQMQMTKKLLKEANATIMLITKKGLSKTELDILTGKNTEFGKVNNKDVFVIINKIGMMYEGRNNEDAIIKIEEAKKKVVEELKENGLNNIKVFTVDSKDFLWSCDEELYEEVIKLNLSEGDIILNQDEYSKRSQFEFFKNKLMEFLEEDQRNKSFLEDINRKIEMLVEIFKEEFSSKEALKGRKENDLERKLSEEKNLLMKNRRKLYNTLVRSISSSFEEFERKIGEDINLLQKSRNVEIAKIIDEKFSDLDNINQKNVNICNEKIQNIINQDAKQCEKSLNKHQEIMCNYVLNNKFKEEFSKAINSEADLSFRIKTKETKIDLKFKEVQFEDTAIIKELKSDMNKKIKESSDLNNLIVREGRSTSVQKVESLKSHKRKIEDRYKNDIKNIGKKPAAVQKYKKVARKVRKWIFFSETVYDTVPDGLDYSNQKQWEKNKNRIFNNYIREKRELEKQSDECESSLKNIERNKNKQEILQKEIIGIQKEIKEMEKIVEENKKNKKQEFIKRKKNEIYKLFSMSRKKAYAELLAEISENIFQIKKNIKDEIKQELENNLTSYGEKLDKKIIVLKEKIEINDEEFMDVMSKLKEIGGRVS